MLSTCISHLAIIGLENQFPLFLRIAVLHRFYCILLFAGGLKDYAEVMVSVDF